MQSAIPQDGPSRVPAGVSAVVLRPPQQRANVLPAFLAGRRIAAVLRDVTTGWVDRVPMCDGPTPSAYPSVRTHQLKKSCWVALPGTLAAPAVARAACSRRLRMLRRGRALEGQAEMQRTTAAAPRWRVRPE
eukprot:gene16073-biopygen9299